MDKPKGYRLFHIVAILSVSTLLISNTIAVKLFHFGNFVFPAGIIVFPVAYILNDVLTEVYGYEKTRSVIWTGFLALAIMVLCYSLAVILSPASFWQDQAAFEKLFKQTPRIAMASILGYLVGSFSNSIILSKMKIITKGKYLWTRTIGSTIVGEGFDSFVFNFVAFAGIFATSDLITVAFSGFVFKVAFEAIATPITYLVIGWLKKAENEDKYDVNVNYNPIKLK